VGSFHPRPPVFVTPSDASLPIIDLTYRLVLEVDLAVCQLPCYQRPCLGRRGEAAAFNPMEALGAARYGRGPEKQAYLAGASQALDRLRLLLRMATDLRCLALARYEELSRMEREIGRLLRGRRKNAAPRRTLDGRPARRGQDPPAGRNPPT